MQGCFAPIFLSLGTWGHAVRVEEATSVTNKGDSPKEKDRGVAQPFA